jgi:hypothetical protein
MGVYEIRERERGDGSEPSLPFLVPDARLSLAEVLHLAEKCGQTVDVTDGGRYLVTYCGASPYWWLPGEHGGGMHQVGSHGWCHDCHKAGEGYVHHLAYEDEMAVLANEARHDRVLREQCEADGQTPEQYAAEVAGRAVPLDGDCSFAVDVHELGADLNAGLAWFAIDMWDMTTWKVAVPIADGAPEAAERLAEKTAYDAQPKRCHDCRGRRGHSKRCGAAEHERFMASPECGQDPCPHEPQCRTFREAVDAKRAAGELAR